MKSFVSYTYKKKVRITRVSKALKSNRSKEIRCFENSILPFSIEDEKDLENAELLIEMEINDNVKINFVPGSIIVLNFTKLNDESELNKFSLTSNELKCLAIHIINFQRTITFALAMAEQDGEDWTKGDLCGCGHTAKILDNIYRKQIDPQLPKNFQDKVLETMKKANDGETDIMIQLGAASRKFLQLPPIED